MAMHHQRNCMTEPLAGLPCLYSFRRCPYAMRARLAIWMSGRQVLLREILLRDKPTSMLALSPKGTVPVLHLSDGRVIDESLDVMFWAIEGTTIVPPSDEQRDLISVFDDRFKFHLDRYKYATRYAGAQAEEHRDAALDILLGSVPRDGHSWLSGDVPGFTDWAVLPFIRQFRIADPDWFDNANELASVRPWLNAFLNWDDFMSCLKKYPVWSLDQPGILFGRSD